VLGLAVRVSAPTQSFFEIHPTRTPRCSWSQAADELGMDSVIRAQMEVSSDDLRRQLAYIADQLVSDAPGVEGEAPHAGKPLQFLFFAVG
jgi:hypothetical protein